MTPEQQKRIHEQALSLQNKGAGPQNFYSVNEMLEVLAAMEESQSTIARMTDRNPAFISPQLKPHEWDDPIARIEEQDVYIYYREELIDTLWAKVDKAEEENERLRAEVEQLTTAIIYAYEEACDEGIDRYAGTDEIRSCFVILKEALQTSPTEPPIQEEDLSESQEASQREVQAYRQERDAEELAKLDTEPPASKHPMEMILDWQKAAVEESRLQVQQECADCTGTGRIRYLDGPTPRRGREEVCAMCGGSGKRREE